MKEVLLILLAFFLGSIPFGFMLYRLKTGEDIRKKGSGNIGATNVLRTAGAGLGIVVAVLDISKAAAAVLIAKHFSSSILVISAAALAAIAGHCFTPFLKFKGGKGVACLVGSFLILSPKSLLVGLGLFFLAIALTRMVSVGSLTLALTLPFLSLLIYGEKWFFFAQLVAAVIIFYRHRENIKRILEKRENVLRFK